MHTIGTYLTHIAAAIMTIAFVTPAAQADRPSMRLISDYPPFAHFSPNYRYLAQVGSTDVVRIGRFDARTGTFEKTGSIRTTSIELCVDDQGFVALRESSSDLIRVFNAQGMEQEGRESSPPCTIEPSRENTPTVGSRDEQRAARRLLCSLPANARASKSLGGSPRIYDMYRIVRRLPGGWNLAEVETSPINGETLKYGGHTLSPALVTISVQDKDTNYCVDLSLSAADETRCGLGRAFSNSTPFVEYFRLPDSTATAPCEYKATVVSHSGPAAPSQVIKIDWLVSEYSSVQLVNYVTLRADGPRKRVGSFKLSNREGGCGYVIYGTFRNPTLRMSAIGLGDLWCSYV